MASNLTALELLKLGNEDRTIPALNKVWPYVLGGIFGIAGGVAMNFGTRRPLFSGIQKHIIGVAGFCAVFDYIQKKRDNYLAEKDAVLRHYIELHPDDFPPPPERKKIGEILEDWIPIR